MWFRVEFPRIGFRVEGLGFRVSTRTLAQGRHGWIGLGLSV